MDNDILARRDNLKLKTLTDLLQTPLFASQDIN